MCTAVSFMGLAGRTLDLECSFGERVALTPRAYAHRFIHEGVIESRHALIGVAHIQDGIPLYYDAMSEAGLYMAALNFPKYAHYREVEAGKINLASAELIPYILASSDSLSEAESELKRVNITPNGVMGLPATALHWFLTDFSRSLVVEQTECGLKITENPHNVLTNSPKIDYHLTKMTEFYRLSPTNPEILEENRNKFPIYSRGMGAIGLPGDYSSSSRFVRAAFLTSNVRSFGKINPQITENNAKITDIFSQIGDKIAENAKKSPQSPKNDTQSKISSFFHLTDSLAVPYGAVLTDEGRAVYTVYTSLADPDSKTYYLTSYECRTPHAYRMVPSEKILTFPLPREEQIKYLSPET